MDFSVFKNKYIIEGNLVVLNGLHIGARIEKNDSDSPFVEYGDGEYYIPGSSFRGYMSTKLERLLQKENGFNFIDKATGEPLNMGDVKLIFGYTDLSNEKDKDIVKKIKKFMGATDEDEKNKAFDSMAGRIHIGDMPLLEETYSITRDGIRIDRETGTTVKGGKFDYDILPAGTKFKMYIEVENIEPYQLDLIFLALRDIWEGDLFGGMLSRGIGKCKLENMRMKVIDNSNMKEYFFFGENKIKFQDIKQFPEIKNIDLK